MNDDLGWGRPGGGAKAGGSKPGGAVAGAGHEGSRRRRAQDIGYRGGRCDGR